MTICNGICKNGKKCGYKAKKYGFCMIHFIDTDECAICMNNIDNKSLILDCGHKFHTECLTKWCQQSPTCPTCRAEIDLPKFNIKIDKILKILETSEKYLFDYDDYTIYNTITNRYMLCFEEIMTLFDTQIFIKQHIIKFLLKNVNNSNKNISELTNDINNIKNLSDEINSIIYPLNNIDEKIANTLEKMITYIKLCEASYF